MVSTRVLSPQMAVVWAAFFNFIAFLFFSHAVANTIGKGIIHPDIVTPAVIFGALMGAIIWNLLTWFLGIPSSSSHALVGGLVGSGVAAGGFSVVVAWGVIKTALFIFLAPILGMAMAIAARDPHLMAAQTGGGDHVGPRLPSPPARLGRRLLARPRRQRRAEDDGDHHRPALLAGLIQGEFHVPFWVVIACQRRWASGP